MNPGTHTPVNSVRIIDIIQMIAIPIISIIIGLYCIIKTFRSNIPDGYLIENRRIPVPLMGGLEISTAYFIIISTCVMLFIFFLFFYIEKNSITGNLELPYKIFNVIKWTFSLLHLVYLGIISWRVFCLHQILPFIVLTFILTLSITYLLFKEKIVYALVATILIVVLSTCLIFPKIERGEINAFNINLRGQTIQPDLFNSAKIELILRNYNNAKLKDCYFRNIKFDGIVFNNLPLENVTFDSCSFSNFIFLDCQFFNSEKRNAKKNRFEGCEFRNTELKNAKLSFVEFIDCNFLDSVDLLNAEIGHVNFSKSNLSGMINIGLTDFCIKEMPMNFIDSTRFPRNVSDAILLQLYKGNKDCRFLLDGSGIYEEQLEPYKN